MKKILCVILSIIMILSALPFCVSAAATSISFVINPSVFLCGSIYNVVWTNDVAGVGYVTYEIDGVEYTVYDEEGGIVRTDDYAHTVSIPTAELDAAGGYTVHAAAVESRTAYSVSLGATCETYRDFHGYTGQEQINVWTVSDTHLTPSNFSTMETYIKRAANNLKGGDPDLIMLLGDIANDVPNKNQALVGVFGIAASLSNGNVPCVYTRGNHETRGEFSGYLLQYFPSDTGEFYFTFDYGPMTSIVLDFGEDKFDEHLEYGGLVNYNNYRETQTEWLKGIESYNNDDATYRIAFCHGPNIHKHFGYNWTRELDRLGTDIMVSGHTHTLRMHLEDHEYYQGFPIMVDGHHISSKGFKISQLLLQDGHISCYGTSDTGGDLLEFELDAGLNPPEQHYPNIGGDDLEQAPEPTAMSQLSSASGAVGSEIKGAPAFSFTTKPTVFDTGDTYTVAWATTAGKNSSGEVYVEYNGERKRFSDDEGGTLRCVGNVHAVKIPKKYLEGNRYEIISRHVKRHAAYGSSMQFGDSVSTGYIQFEGYSGQDEIKIAVVSDTVSDKSAFYKLQELGTEYDLLMLTGNNVIKAETSADIINGLLINTGYLTGGKRPVVFARGAAETKGEYAPYLSWIVRNSTRQFFEKVEYGPITVAVLDSSGLVPDTDPDTNGMSCFASVRAKQQSWLDSFSYGDAQYKLALTHAPNISSLVGHNFARSLNDLGTDLLVSSGLGYSDVSELGSDGHNFITVKNGNLYTDGTVATLLTFKDGKIESSVIRADGTQDGVSVDTSYNDPVTFADVGNAWYQSAVHYVSRQHLMKGVASGVFAPEDALTRAQAAVVIANLENADLECFDGVSFADVDKNTYYAKAVDWAKQNGITFGVGNGDFDPDAPITREQLCTMLTRLYGDTIAGYGDSAFTPPADADDISAFAYDSVMLLYKKGIVCGEYGRFLPREGITRAQFAQILYKARLNVQITNSGIGQ